MYKLPIFQTIKKRIEEPRRFIQVILGPRQVGKSTVIKQVVNDLNIPHKIFSADFVPASNSTWIIECWETARMLSQSRPEEGFLLVIDEIQKIDNWSEIVKKLWDEDSFYERNIRVVLLGSSRILIRKGLSESLAGRFEEIRMSQWSWQEMHDCFGLSLDEYLYYGGYPGASPLIKDPDRFDAYIEGSIIDSSINKDILFDSKIAKPALLRQTFEISSAYSGEILSLTKLLGQLQDAGNTTTLSHYLYLLRESCLVAGLMKYAADAARRRASLPKFQVFDNSLKNVYLPTTMEEAKKNPAMWGRVYESAVGAYIMCQAFKHRIEVFYWREKNLEVDFVLRKNGVTVALEVKSNTESYTKGLAEFKERFKPHRALIIGEGGIPVEYFFSLQLPVLFT